MRNRFTNPANGTFYDWQRNHSEEEDLGKTREISRAPNTAGVRAARTQGDDGPLVLKFSGHILHRAQLQQFWGWFELSRNQTIYFRDYDNQQYEVIMTSFTPKRIRKLPTVAPDPSAPNHYWTYSMEMEVVRVLAGDLAGVAT